MADLDLVIFDCDGVLIDSEVISAEALIAEAATVGLNVSRDHVRRHFLGRSFPTVARTIREQFDVTLPAEFEANYRARLLARFEAELRPTAGVENILARMAVPYCVATSSSPPRVARSLEIAGLAAYFGNRVFTASQVARGKPAPDLFLFAARQSGADPARCLVIEDSRPGIEAALAAGMWAVLFTGGSHMKGRGFDAGPDVEFLDGWDGAETLLPGMLQREDPR